MNLGEEGAGEEATDPALNAAVVKDCLARSGIESLALFEAEGVFLDEHADIEDRREGVGELHDAECCDKAGESAEGGHVSC